MVDDHALVRDGIKSIISSQDDMVVVATADTARAGLEAVEREEPQVVLMDLRLPQLDGLAAVGLLKERFPSVKVLMLSSADGDRAISSSLAAGAAGYVLKSAPVSDLLDAIRTVFQGRKYVSLDAAVELAVRRDAGSLTEREAEVLCAVAEGHSNGAIAKALGLSEKTIKNHLANVFEKLNASDRTHAVTIALQRGIIELPQRSRR